MRHLLALLTLALLAGGCRYLESAVLSQDAAAGTVSAGDIRFAHAPQGRVDSVFLTGDFAGWEPYAIPMRDPEGDGVWTAVQALEPGTHQFQFVVLSNRWHSDPLDWGEEHCVRRSEIQTVRVEGVRGW